MGSDDTNKCLIITVIVTFVIVDIIGVVLALVDIGVGRYNLKTLPAHAHGGV